MPDLERLPHLLDRRRGRCRAIIETPRGSRNKFTYDAKSGAFELSGLLPDGMSIPLDFGFIPSTRAEDGDPTDVLVLADQALPVGALVGVRLIGVIEGEQTEKGKTVRNDRLLAVSEVSHLYDKVAAPDDLGEAFMANLTRFWVNYNALKGKTYKVIGVHDRDRAVAIIEQTSRPKRKKKTG